MSHLLQKKENFCRNAYITWSAFLIYLFASGSDEALADIKLKTDSSTTKWNSNKKQHKRPESKSQVFNICHEREAAGRVFPSQLWRPLPAHRGRLFAAEFYLVWKSWTPSARAGWLLEALQSSQRAGLPRTGAAAPRVRAARTAQGTAWGTRGEPRHVSPRPFTHLWCETQMRQRRVNLAFWHQERQVPGKHRSFTRSCDNFKLIFIQSTCFLL